jgi:hypothetical protein
MSPLLFPRQRSEGELFAFAGIWDRWKNARRYAVETCSILTTTPNAVTAAVHDHMPVILDLDSYDLWLNPELRNVDFVSEPLKPFNAQAMRSYPISTRINHAVNDDEQCSAPIELAQAQNQLFSYTVMLFVESIRQIVFTKNRVVIAKRCCRWVSPCSLVNT